MTGPPPVGKLGSHWWVVLLTRDSQCEKGLRNQRWSPTLITCFSPPKRPCCILTHTGHGLASGDTGGVSGGPFACLIPAQSHSRGPLGDQMLPSALGPLLASAGVQRGWGSAAMRCSMGWGAAPPGTAGSTYQLGWGEKRAAALSPVPINPLCPPAPVPQPISPGFGLLCAAG